MSDADFEGIYAGLIAKHGGAEVLGPADKAIVRQMAILLSADFIDAGDARAIGQLEAMLPGQAEEPTAWDLTKLSDSELELLQALGTKAAPSGAVPSSGDRLIEASGQLEAVTRDLATGSGSGVGCRNIVGPTKRPRSARRRWMPRSASSGRGRGSRRSRPRR
jgi:hypothetical protein